MKYWHTTVTALVGIVMLAGCDRKEEVQTTAAIAVNESVQTEQVSETAETHVQIEETVVVADVPEDTAPVITQDPVALFLGGTLEQIQQAIEGGLDVNNALSVNMGGEAVNLYPLHLIMMRAQPDVEILNILHAAGADINVRGGGVSSGPQGVTPLMVAAANDESGSCVLQFMVWGASVKDVDSKGFNAMAYAIDSDNRGALYVLSMAGNYSMTPKYLFAAFQENELRAAQNFENKLAAIGGQVFAVGRDRDGVYVELDSRLGAFALVRAYIVSRQDAVAELNKGDNVIVVGRVKGKDHFERVILNDAAISFP